MKLTKRSRALEGVMEARDLTDEELKTVVGGRCIGDPKCPRCHNKNVVFNARLGAVSSCKACGYSVE